VKARHLRYVQRQIKTALNRAGWNKRVDHPVYDPVCSAKMWRDRIERSVAVCFQMQACNLIFHDERGSAPMGMEWVTRMCEPWFESVVLKIFEMGPSASLTLNGKW
jgi:hypothetical protein